MAYYTKRKTKKGTVWQYQISYYDNHGKQKWKTKSGFPTKKAAKEEAEDLEEHFRKTTSIPDAEKLFTDYYAEWVDTYKAGHFSDETDKTYRTAQNLVDRYFEGIRMKNLTMDDFQQFINDYAKDHAKTTVRKYSGRIGACLKHAFHTGIIPADVSYKPTISGKPSRSESEKYLEEKELIKLTKALEENLRFSYVSRYILLLQATTGLRIGEALGLTFDSFDFENQTLTINKAWDYKRTQNFTDTKNGVHRVIDLDEQTIDRIKLFYEYQRKQSLKSIVKNPKNLVFVDDKMGTFTPDAVNKALKKACKRAGIKKITTHGLRHTHASILLLHGVDIQIVAERLGDTPETITKVYAHILDSMREKNKDLIKEISASAFG